MTARVHDAEADLLHLTCIKRLRQSPADNNTILGLMTSQLTKKKLLIRAVWLAGFAERAMS